jgi:hypothetical protein
MARWCAVRHALKEVRLQNPVLTNRNGIRGQIVWGKQPYSCNALKLGKGRHGRSRSDRRKERSLTGGGLSCHGMAGEKSAEVIVVAETSLSGERKVISQEVSQAVKD